MGQQGGVTETRSSRPPRAKPELHQRACRAQRPGGFSVLVTFAQRLGSRPQLLGVQGRGQAAVDSGMSDRRAEGRAGRECVPLPLAAAEGKGGQAPVRPARSTGCGRAERASSSGTRLTPRRSDREVVGAWLRGLLCDLSPSPRLGSGKSHLQREQHGVLSRIEISAWHGGFFFFSWNSEVI